MIYLVLFCKVVGCSKMYVYENVTYQWCFILLPIGIGAGLEWFIQGFSDKLDLDSDLFCMVVIHSPLVLLKIAMLFNLKLQQDI